MAPVASRLPRAMIDRVAAGQRPGVPIFGPSSALAGGPEGLLDAGPLYAGECVARIDDLRPAAELTRELGAI